MRGEKRGITAQSTANAKAWGQKHCEAPVKLKVSQCSEPEECRGELKQERCVERAPGGPA